MVCDSALLLCVSPAVVADGGDEEVIPEEDASDASPDRDAPSGPSPVGGNCVVDGDCSPGLLCGTSTVLTTAIVPTTSKPVCTKPCCTSADCTPGFICFAGATGGNYCVSAAKAQRTPPATGGKTPGQTCGGPTECRSGLCTSGRCVDSCCAANECATGSTCRVAALAAHTVWACAAPNGGAAKDLNASCNATTECKNDNCVFGVFPNKRCTPPCCRASDCTSQGFTNNVCAYGANGNDYIKWCFEPNTGGKALGAACNANTDCLSRYCDGELAKCANVCCTTEDCASGESCRPSPVGTPYLRCVKNR
jgi:hypothetical protein